MNDGRDKTTSIKSSLFQFEPKYDFLYSEILIINANQGLNRFKTSML